MVTSRTQLAAALLLALALPACSDDSQAPDARGDLPTASDRSSAPVEARPAEARLADRAAESIAIPDHGLVTSCAAIGSKECFANLECAADRRCKNVGTASDPIACCVPGLRGTKAAGELCTSEDDCASAVCIAKSGASRCSKDCASVADCPTGMKDCKAIAMSGSSRKWCFPES